MMLSKQITKENLPLKANFHSPLCRLVGMKVSTRYLQFMQSAGSGKLYVTNSDFSNGIGRLCVIILYPFFPSVKFLMPNILSKV